MLIPRSRLARFTVPIFLLNAAAIGLYRAFGFVETGVRRNYYGRGEDAIIMSRTRVGGAESPAPQRSAEGGGT